MRVLLSPSPAAAPHVLMSADAVGGVWQYSLDLAAGLVRRGLAVTVAVLGPAPSEARIAAAEAATGGAADAMPRLAPPDGCRRDGTAGPPGRL